MNEITRRLKLARTRRDLTMQQAAAAMDINLRQLTRWESGKDEPRLSHISKIVVLYQIELIWLFFGVSTGKRYHPNKPEDAPLKRDLPDNHLNTRELELITALYYELPIAKDPRYMFDYIVLRGMGLVKDETLTPEGLSYCRQFVEAS